MDYGLWNIPAKIDPKLCTQSWLMWFFGNFFFCATQAEVFGLQTLLMGGGSCGAEVVGPRTLILTATARQRALLFDTFLSFFPLFPLFLPPLQSETCQKGDHLAPGRLNFFRSKLRGLASVSWRWKARGLGCTPAHKCCRPFLLTVISRWAPVWDNLLGPEGTLRRKSSWPNPPIPYKGCSRGPILGT